MEETLLDRIESRRKELGMTERHVGLAGAGNPDLLRDMRRKGTTPKRDALAGIAELLETTVEYLLYGKRTGAVIAGYATGYDGEAEPLPFGKPLARTMPVYGTALGSDTLFDGAEIKIETHVIEMTDVIDWVRRPPILEGRKDVYALYISGHSMEPRFEPGDPVIVDPKRAPKLGDDVIVQIAATLGDDAEVKVAVIKRLVRRTANHVELRQYNPSLTFTVPAEQILFVHRVLGIRDMLG